MSEERHDTPPPPESVATPAAAPKPQPITDQAPTMFQGTKKGSLVC